MEKNNRKCYNMFIMTPNQRDYLADLANQKGVRVEADESRSPAWASAEIERLKALPDAEFREVSDDDDKKLAKTIEKVNAEADKWQLE